MIKREVIKGVLGGEKPPYVPWSFKFTKKLKEAFMQYYDTDDPVMMDLIVEAEAFGVHLVFRRMKFRASPMLRCTTLRRSEL